MGSNRQSVFQMHESAAMRLCQLAFLLMGGLPVLASLGWIVLECLPSHQQARTRHWEAALSNKLGLAVSIDRVQARSPTRWLFQGVTLRNPESKQVICRLAEAKADQVAEQWIIHVAEAEFASGQAAGVWKATHDWLLCRPDEISSKVAIGLDQVHWLGGASQHTLSDVRLTLLPSATHQMLHVQFLPEVASVLPELAMTSPGLTSPGLSAVSAGLSAVSAGLSAVSPEKLAAEQAAKRAELEPITVLVRREYESAEGPESAEGTSQVTAGTYQTAIRLKTGSTPLPCSLVGDAVNSLRMLGNAATFTGVVDVLCEEDSWVMWLNRTESDELPQSVSVFKNLDFERLTWGTGARLQGLGTLTLSDACVTESGLQSLSGSLDISSGRSAARRNHIGSRFLRQAGRFLDIQLASDALDASSRSDYPFDQLRLGFALRPGLLYLQGGPGGEIIKSQQQSLAWRAPTRWQQPLRLSNVVGLLQTLESQEAAAGALLGQNTGWLSRLAGRWLPEAAAGQIATRPDSDLTHLE